MSQGYKDCLFISYADGSLHLRHQENQIKSFVKYNLKAKVKLLGKHNIDEAFASKNKHILKQKRGAGLWLWKPYLIYKELKQMPDGDVLFYCDSDWIFNKSPKRFIDMALNKNILLFHENGAKAREWTQSSTFEAMNADKHKYQNTTMLLAGYSLWNAGKQSRQFAKKWLTWCCNSKAMGTERDRKHCFDQSILTILAAQEGIKAELSPKMDDTIKQQ